MSYVVESYQKSRSGVPLGETEADEGARYDPSLLIMMVMIVRMHEDDYSVVGRRELRGE